MDKRLQEQVERLSKIHEAVEGLDLNTAFNILNSAFCLRYGAMWIVEATRKASGDVRTKTPFDDMDTE